MPPSRKKTEQAEPAAEVTEPTTEETPAADTAALLAAAAANLLSLYLGHTDNTPAYLGQGNRPTWAPSIMEAVSLTNAGVQLYTGPQRQPDTEPGKWKTKNVAGDADNATRNGWYHPLERRDAALRVAEGLALMGWDDEHALAWYAPDRSACYRISTAADPVAVAINLATSTSTRTSTSPDGLNRESRRKLDSSIKDLVKRARDGKSWGGSMTDLAEDYTPAQILASVERVTKGEEDSAMWVAAMGKVIEPETAVVKAESTD